MPGELDVLQPSVGIEFHGEMNFVAARRIIPVHPHRRVGQLAKIPRPPRMIEDHFLIKLFDFRDHDSGRTRDRPSLGEKKRTALWRISIIRSISSHRVVKIKARASRSWHTKPAHQRLVAMVSAAHRQPVLIRERGQIVRMHRVHHKSYERPTLFGWPKNARTGQFRKALGCITRKPRVVFENCRAPDPFDVINRCRKPDCAGDVRRTCFKPVRRFLERALFQASRSRSFRPRRATVASTQESPLVRTARRCRSGHTFCARKRPENRNPTLGTSTGMCPALCAASTSVSAPTARAFAQSSATGLIVPERV